MRPLPQPAARARARGGERQREEGVARGAGIRAPPAPPQPALPHHQAADLGTLLEMYRAWGSALLPGASFPVVVDQLEAVGKTHALKLEMREVR